MLAGNSRLLRMDVPYKSVILSHKMSLILAMCDDLTESLVRNEASQRKKEKNTDHRL